MTMMQNTKRRYLPCNVHGAAGSATALRLWLSIGLPPFQRLRPPPPPPPQPPHSSPMFPSLPVTLNPFSSQNFISRSVIF